MTQQFPPCGDDRDASNERDRWLQEAPTAAVARVVLQIDKAITLQRRANAARLTAQGDAVPLLPIKPSRLELAVVIALAETYGAALHRDPRFLPVIDFIAEYGAVALVQRVLYGERLDDEDSNDCSSSVAEENVRLARVVHEARSAFEFLCATWPEVFLNQAHGMLAKIGVRVWPLSGEPNPPSKTGGAEDFGPEEDNENDERDQGEEGGRA